MGFSKDCSGYNAENGLLGAGGRVRSHFEGSQGGLEAAGGNRDRKKETYFKRDLGSGINKSRLKRLGRYPV